MAADAMTSKFDPDQQPPSSDGDDAKSLAHFIDKWRGRWPEWSVAEVFVAASQRERALAWATLQQELTDAAWGGSDPRPGAAKLAWWQEELVGWGRGARRHPLGAVLQRCSAPWDGLAAGLPSLANSRDRPAKVEEALDGVLPVANAMAAVDAALFESACHDDDALVIASMLLHARFAQPGDTHAPLDILARAGAADPRSVWAAELRRHWPSHRPASRCRRLWAELAKTRLERGPDRALPVWTTLWVSWRAARR